MALNASAIDISDIFRVYVYTHVGYSRIDIIASSLLHTQCAYEYKRSLKISDHQRMHIL